MLTHSLLGSAPLSASDVYGAPSAVGPSTQPQAKAAKHGVAAAVAVQGGDYQIGPATPGPVIAGIFFVVALMFAVRLATDGAHEVTKRDKTQFKNVDVTIWNCIIIGLMAAPGVVLWKTLAVKYLNPRNPVRMIYEAA